MTEWTELKTLQDVAAAQARGDEIEWQTNASRQWKRWLGNGWHTSSEYRSRPKKKTKIIVLREALMFNGIFYWTQYYSENRTEDGDFSMFVRWIDTPPREVEVEE